MAQQIVKQPDGKYAVWSTVVDDFVVSDATKGEIIGRYVGEEVTRIIQRVDEIIDELDKGGKPYYQFTKTYDELIELRNDLQNPSEEE